MTRKYTKLALVAVGTLLTSALSAAPVAFAATTGSTGTSSSGTSKTGTSTTGKTGSTGSTSTVIVGTDSEGIIVPEIQMGSRDGATYPGDIPLGTISVTGGELYIPPAGAIETDTHTSTYFSQTEAGGPGLVSRYTGPGPTGSHDSIQIVIYVIPNAAAGSHIVTVTEPGGKTVKYQFPASGAVSLASLNAQSNSLWTWPSTKPTSVTIANNEPEQIYTSNEPTWSLDGGPYQDSITLPANTKSTVGFRWPDVAKVNGFFYGEKRVVGTGSGGGWGVSFTGGVGLAIPIPSTKTTTPTPTPTPTKPTPSPSPSPTPAPTYVPGKTIIEPPTYVPGKTIIEPPTYIPGPIVPLPTTYVPGPIIPLPTTYVPGPIIPLPTTYVPGKTIVEPNTIIQGKTIVEPNTIIRGKTIVEPNTVIPGKTIVEPPTVVKTAVSATECHPSRTPWGWIIAVLAASDAITLLVAALLFRRRGNGERVVQ